MASGSKPTNVEDLADQAIARLRAFTDRDRHAATQNYYPSAQENLGVYAADMRLVVREFKARLKAESAATVLKFALAVIARNTMEGRQCAYEILASHKAAAAALKPTQIQRLGKGIDNWASVDGFACGISGPAWREGRLTDADIRRWANSTDPWWRRAAVVSSVPLNIKSRGGKGDVKRTLMVCELVIGDEHIMVHKALSWALRELSRVDRKAVESFLRTHDAALPALVKREVQRKLKTGRKYG
ncbi:MAG: DNA alkylation repair protein [Planctomycetes bacterium]|nr:DNA alkylation repair protein [Planctomycetota bacterium]